MTTTEFPQTNPTPSGPAPTWRIGLLVAIVIAASTGACGTARAPLDANVTDSARRSYYRAMQELVDGNFAQATGLLNQVARSPRYVGYAPLAKLRVADALYLQDRYSEAAEVYRGFLNQYKSDPNVPYARFRIASSYYQRLPSEWFATPPAHEMDQTLTRQAEAELQGFVSTFPTSRFAADARKMLTEARQLLFAHELFAADYYAARNKWRAVAWRLDRAVTSYPELATHESLIWRMADAYAKADDPAEAARAYGLYLKKFPEGAHRAEAKSRLEVIRNRVAPTPEKS